MLLFDPQLVLHHVGRATSPQEKYAENHSHTLENISLQTSGYPF
jgi:hypothetical protein